VEKDGKDGSAPVCKGETSRPLAVWIFPAVAKGGTEDAGSIGVFWETGGVERHVEMSEGEETVPEETVGTIPCDH